MKFSNTRYGQMVWRIKGIRASLLKLKEFVESLSIKGDNATTQRKIILQRLDAVNEELTELRIKAKTLYEYNKRGK